MWRGICARAHDAYGGDRRPTSAGDRDGGWLGDAGWGSLISLPGFLPVTVGFPSPVPSSRLDKSEDFWYTYCRRYTLTLPVAGGIGSFVAVFLSWTARRRVSAESVWKLRLLEAQPHLQSRERRIE